jgi:O-antigen/teichoic acid export membrane protein
MISRSILKNTLSGYLKFLVPFAIGMLLTPFIIQHIGIAAYGLWALVLSTTGFFALMDLGFGQAIVRYVAMNKAAGSREELDRLISTFLVVYGLVACVILAATLFLSLNFPRFFQVNPDQVSISQWALLISGLGIALRFPLNIFGGLLHGYQRYDLAFGTEVLFHIVNAVLTVVLLNMGYGLLALMLIASSTSLAAALVIAFHAFRIVGPLKISLLQFQWNKVMEILSFSTFFFFMSLAVMISHRSDQVVIGIFLPTTAVAIYAISLKIAELVRRLAGQLNSILFPVAAELHALADASRLREVMLGGSRLSVALAAGMGLGVVAIGKPFIGLWVGPEFLAGYPVLVVLTAVSVAAVAQDLPSKVLMVIGKQRLMAGISLLDAFANLLLSITLVQFLGILGVALGTLIPFFAVASFNLVYASRCVGLSTRSFLLALAFPGFVPGLMAGAVLWLLQAWSYPQSWFTLGWQGATGVAVFGITCLAMGIVRLDRRTLIAPARRLVKVARPPLE